jgi:hypothetical protein
MHVRPQDIRWRLLTFFAGMVLTIGVEFPLDSLLSESHLILPILVISYGLVAAILAFYSQHKSWQVALLLVTLFVVVAVGNIVFIDVPIPWEAKIKALIEDTPIVIAAFLGAALGSFLKRRLKSASAPSHDGTTRPRFNH